LISNQCTIFFVKFSKLNQLNSHPPCRKLTAHASMHFCFHLDPPIFKHHTLLALISRFTKVLFFLSVCLGLACTSTFAQNIKPTGNPEFDSLILVAIDLRYKDLEGAIKTMERAQSLPNLSNLQEGMIANQLGALNYVKGNYAASVKEYSKAFELLESEGDLYQKALALNGRGLIYLSQHAYAQAASIFKQCVEINLARQDSLSLGANYLNLGISLSELGQYNEAIEALAKGYDFTANLQESIQRMMIINRQGQIQLELGNLSEAKVLFNGILEEYPQLTNWEKSFATTGLGLIALEENQLQKALELGLKGYEYAKLASAYWDQERASSLLSKAYEQLGDYKNALLYSRLNKVHADTLYNDDKNSEISYHQLQMAEADKATLEQKNLIAEQKAKISNYTLIGLSAILALLTMIILLNRRWLKKKEELNLQLLEKQKEVISQNDTLNQLNEEKNKLFSILSHDLKTPMNAIRQMLELHEMDLLSEQEKEESYKLLLKQVKQTEQKIEQLLRWSHAQMEGIVTEKEPLDLSLLIKETINQNEVIAQKKNINIKFTFEEHRFRILADPSQLRIVFQNCLQNAIKFSHVGGEISLELEDLGNLVKFKIKDCGVGMTPEKLQEISQKKSIVSSTEGTNKEKGTGLGLFLIKQFMETNGGELMIESEHQKGTVLHLTFEKAS
jgi:signal transduction histidine kinase